MTGGYDDGYCACDCFWGREPSSLVKLLASQLGSVCGLTVLDAGCGEGKNAAFLAHQGAQVSAFDISTTALENARKAWENSDRIHWETADIRSIPLPEGTFDIVIAYGLLHCLASSGEISAVVNKLKAATKPRGFAILCAFNNRSQDLTAHPGFKPCLMPHEFYLGLFSDWDIILSTDNDLTEIHPHNMIEHTHSMTRILARKEIVC